MKHYEMLYIIAPNFSDEQQAKITAELTALIKNEGGTVTAGEILGSKKLTYAIKKAAVGFYHLLEFDLEPAKIKNIQHKSRLMPEILRFIIVIKKKVTEKPKTATRPKPSEAAPPRIFKKAPPKEGLKEKPKKVSIEELDKKLDEILKDDVVKE